MNTPDIGEVDDVADDRQWLLGGSGYLDCRLCGIDGAGVVRPGLTTVYLRPAFTRRCRHSSLATCGLRRWKSTVLIWFRLIGEKQVSHPEMTAADQWQRLDLVQTMQTLHLSVAGRRKLSTDCARFANFLARSTWPPGSVCCSTKSNKGRH